MTPEDVPWALSLAHRRYSQGYDPGGGLLAFLDAIKSPRQLALRSDNGFLGAQIAWPPWRPQQRDCMVVVLCTEEGHHWEAVQMLRYSVVWAREQKCTRWFLGGDGEKSLAALARRVGAGSMPVYRIELAGEQ